MNKTTKKIILILIAVIAVCLMLTACDSKVVIMISAVKTELVAGDEVALNVLVSNGGAYTLTVDNTDIAKIEGNNLKVLKSVDVDTDITVTATLVDNPKISEKKVFVVKSQVNPITILADKYTFDYQNPLTVQIDVPEGEDYLATIMPSGKAMYSKYNSQLVALSDVSENTEITLVVSLQSNSAIKAEKKFIIMPTPKKPTLNINFTDKITNTNQSVYVTPSPVSSQIILSLSGEGSELLEVDGNYIRFKGTELPAYDMRVNVRAELKDDPEVNVTKVLTIKAKVQEGQVAGKNFTFTSAHLAKLFTNNLTITGTLTDCYRKAGSATIEETPYDITVMMNEGKWWGAWNAVGQSNRNVEYYYKGVGENDIVEIVENKVTNSYNVIYKSYVDKDNNVSTTILKDYESTPALWQKQYYWNPFEEYISINNIEYDNQLDMFQIVPYSANGSTSEANNKFAYFSAYLAFAFTPILTASDTLTDIYLMVELVDGVPTVTGLKAATPQIALSETEVEYTTIELRFTDIDSTVIEEVQPNGEPANKDLLASALEEMRNADNYYFKAVETPTYTPTSDESDYVTAATSLYATKNSPIKNETVSNGYEGLEGWITNSSIMLKRGVKIQDDGGFVYAMTYTGYRANANNTHDFFEYVGGSTAKFVAKQQKQGSLDTELPKFDMSVNAFRYVGQRQVSGRMVHVFTLNDANNTRAVAMQMTMHSYASDACFDANRRLEVYVSAEGNLVSVVFPYEISRGDRGYVTVNYSGVGTTTEIVSLQESGDEANYIPRERKSTWAEVVIDDYRPSHSTLTPPESRTADYVLKAILGQSVNINSIPSFGEFVNLFDDNVTSVSFNYTEVSTNKYKDIIRFNIGLDKTLLDENSKLLTEQYEEILENLKTMMAKYNFTYDANNSRYERDPDTNKVDVMYTSTRYASFISEQSENCQILVYNLRTGWLYVEIMPLGAWQLS